GSLNHILLRIAIQQHIQLRNFGYPPTVDLAVQLNPDLHSSAYLQSLLTTPCTTTALANNSTPSPTAYPVRPYNTFPTDNNADHIIVHPLNHPTSASGMLSPSTFVATSPTSARTRFHPGPNGRTFR